MFALLIFLSSTHICKQPATMAEEHVKVKMLCTSTVVPAVPTVKRSMFLSNLDLIWIPIANSHSVLFYKTNPEMEFTTVTDMLKRSLSSVLVDFYPVAGRLSTKASGETGRPEIDCNDGGVEFVEASIDMDIEDLEEDEFRHKSFFKELVPMRDGSKHENYDGPLFSVQVTGFRGGGICIGSSIHHVVADGSSFWHLMFCWAECCRGSPVSKKPEHMRTTFKREEKIDCATTNISFSAEEVVINNIEGAQIFKFVRDDLLTKDVEINVSKSEADKRRLLEFILKDQTEDLEICSFHFNEEMIEKLKERAGTSSSFVAVSAHFWICVTRAREVPDNEPVGFGMSANSRGRVKPPLPPTFLGNCICMGFAQTTAKQLLGQDIRFAATLIKELIKSCSSEGQVDNLIDWVDCRLGSGSPLPSLALEIIGGRYFVVAGNSPKFPVYELDYGWGKPLNAQIPTLNGVGAMMLFPGRDDGIDIHTRLPPRQMETLKQILMIIPD
uniref:Uncharacterized protein n=1 Tax=Picea sitchensis TaxID=3332 RepID=B8LQ10_PICSI|nr:unknown [Picea sitchensis]